MPARNNSFHQLSSLISSMQGQYIGHCIATDSSTGCCALQNAVVVHMIARCVPISSKKTAFMDDSLEVWVMGNLQDAGPDKISSGFLRRPAKGVHKVESSL